MKTLFNKIKNKVILSLTAVGIFYGFSSTNVSSSQDDALEIKRKLDSLQTIAVDKYKETSDLKDCLLKQKDPTECSYSILENLDLSKKAFEEYKNLLSTKGKKIPVSLSLTEVNVIIGKEGRLINEINNYLSEKSKGSSGSSKEKAKQCVSNHGSLTEYLNNSIAQ